MESRICNDYFIEGLSGVFTPSDSACQVDISLVGGGKTLRDSENTGIPNLAPGFGSDFVVPIEQNRRRNRATSRILQLGHSGIWPEDGTVADDCSTVLCFL